MKCIQRAGDLLSKCPTWPRNVSPILTYHWA